MPKTILYKLTEQDGTTRNGMKWEVGKTNLATGPGRNLCSSGVLHAYHSPLEAIFMNPVHAGISNPLMFEVEGVVRADDGTKVGCRKLKATRRIKKIPVISREVRIRTAIYCAKLVYKGSEWDTWADNWLSGKDRSLKAAAEAAEAEAAAATRAEFNLTSLIKKAIREERKLCKNSSSE